MSNKPRVAAAAFALAVILAPSTTIAQTTTCGEEWGKWVCRTKPSRPAQVDISKAFPRDDGAGQRGADQTRRLLETYQAANPPAPDTPPPPLEGGKNSKLRSKVAAALREGRCEEAKQIALAGDDIDLADKAVRICSPAAAKP